MIVRLSKAALVAAVALLFAAVAYGNITDIDDSIGMMQRILSMAGTAQDEDLMGRAIENARIHVILYFSLVGAQILVALLCSFGSLRLVMSLFASDAEYNKAKSLAVSGLTLGFLIYSLGYLVIAEEWFAMWQSPQWHGDTVTRFLVFIGVVLILVIHKDETVVEDIYSMRR